MLTIQSKKFGNEANSLKINAEIADESKQQAHKSKQIAYKLKHKVYESNERIINSST